MKKKRINESTQLYIDKILNLLNKKVSKEIVLNTTNIPEETTVAEAQDN